MGVGGTYLHRYKLRGGYIEDLACGAFLVNECVFARRFDVVRCESCKLRQSKASILLPLLFPRFFSDSYWGGRDGEKLMVLRVRLREVHSHLHSLRGQRRRGRHADVGGSATPAPVLEISDFSHLKIWGDNVLNFLNK